MWNILDLIFKKFYNFLYATPSPLKKQGENISIRFIIVTVIAIYFLRQIVFFLPDGAYWKPLQNIHEFCGCRSSTVVYNYISCCNKSAKCINVNVNVIHNCINRRQLIAEIYTSNTFSASRPPILQPKRALVVCLSVCYTIFKATGHLDYLDHFMYVFIYFPFLSFWTAVTHYTSANLLQTCI